MAEMKKKAEQTEMNRHNGEEGRSGSSVVVAEEKKRSKNIKLLRHAQTE